VYVPIGCRGGIIACTVIFAPYAQYIFCHATQFILLINVNGLLHDWSEDERAVDTFGLLLHDRIVNVDQDNVMPDIVFDDEVKFVHWIVVLYHVEVHF
jgi:hypothetical protein